LPDLTHVDAAGNARMVDTGDKAITLRTATAEGEISLSEAAFRAVVDRESRKGDVLAVAQLAGIQAAKRTPDLIPLCHPLPLDAVEVQLTAEAGSRRVVARATVRTTAVSAALLTVYDMLKAVDRGMEISAVRLLEKRGGRSGDWSRG
jgi:cyclic pyranopterin phosphate synthase